MGRYGQHYGDNYQVTVAVVGRRIYNSIQYPYKIKYKYLREDRKIVKELKVTGGFSENGYRYIRMFGTFKHSLSKVTLLIGNYYERSSSKIQINGIYSAYQTSNLRISGLFHMISEIKLRITGKYNFEKLERILKLTKTLRFLTDYPSSSSLYT